MSHRTRRSRLFRVARGVYAVGTPALGKRAVALAAVLTSCPGALLTAAGALDLWGVEGPRPTPIDVLTPTQRRPQPGVRPRRTRTLHDLDRCALDQIPLAAPARALLDFATTAEPDGLEAALDGLRSRNLLRDRDLDDLRRRTHGHRGWGPLNSLLRSRNDPGFSRSRAERMTLRLIRAAGLPLPRRNVRAEGWEADLLWPEHGLAVEFDSWRHHSGHDSFELDRAKSTELEARGITVVRITWRQLNARPEWVVARLAEILARR